MEKLKFADYDKEGLDFLANRGRPIPGQSLTNDPDNPYPWESPPEFTNLQSATDALFVELTEPEVYESILNMIQSGESIANVAQIVLYDGFQKGMFNPDLLMLLIEPTMYMLMALSEKAGVDDYKIYDDEEEDEFDSNEQLEGMDRITSTMKKGVIPREIEQKIERLEIPERKSLLERNEQPQIEEQSDSLLDEGEK